MGAREVFTTSPAEVAKLGRIVTFQRLAAALAGLLCLPAAWGYGPLAQGGAALLALGLLVFAWRYQNKEWLKQLSERVLRIQAQAIEISRGKFTRFVLYEDIRLVRVQRKKDDSITAIILVTQEGPLLIRGFEQMELIFGHISARKPERALIQIEPAPLF
jgi:hypothetical protein